MKIHENLPLNSSKYFILFYFVTNFRKFKLFSNFLNENLIFNRSWPNKFFSKLCEFQTSETA